MSVRRRRGRLALGATLAVLPVLLVVGPAQAVHWPFFGGDAGRSGYQPVDEGTTPVPFLYSKLGVDAPIQSSILTTAGAPATQRMIYGTANGNVHLQILADGTPAPGVPEAGIDINEHDVTDTFGRPGASSVSFADTSGPGLGQLYVVHNDADGVAVTPDIEIARIDEATGAVVQVPVAGTAGFDIDSSPILTAPAPDGSRTLFFVATRGGDGRLFRVPLTNAAATTATIGPATATGNINATDVASPTIVMHSVGGVATPFIAVGTAGGIVDVDATTTIPVASPPTDLDGGAGQTPSVPVAPSGQTPSPAPFIYIAASVPTADPAVDVTEVFKLDAQTLAVLGTSDALDGAPAPALATSQETTTPPEEGKIIVTTEQNLYLLPTAVTGGALGPPTPFSPDPLVPGEDGFSQTTAAASGDLVFVTNDQSEQFVLGLANAQPVAGFTANPAAVATVGTGEGQPSLSRGFVQFGGGTGAFVYRTTDAENPTVALTAPAAGATVSGVQTLSATAFDTRGIASVQFRLDGQPAGTDQAPDSGSPFGAPGAAFSVAFDTRTLANGTHVLDAVATDTSGRTTTAASRTITIANAAAPGPGAGAAPPAEDRPPTVAFSAPAANALVRTPTTVSATASDDRGIASVRFSVGDRVVCTDTSAPYSCAASFTGADVGRNSLFAVATDTSGQTGSAVRVVTVDRFTPRRVSATVTPTRDRRAPYRFRTRGTVSLPTGVTRAQACGEGVVSVQVKRGRTTLSTRRTTLSRTCTYSSTVTFSVRRRLGRSGRLKVTARFLGNDVLKRRNAASRTVRAG